MPHSALVVEGLVAILLKHDAAAAAACATLVELHVLLYGGAALPCEHSRALCDRGIVLQCAYGQTELAGPVLYGKQGSRHAVYRPLEGIAYELVQSVDDGPNQGELVLLGCRSVTPGYIASRAPDTFSSGVRRERYNTGDRFERVQLLGHEGDWLRYMLTRFARLRRR